MGKGTLRRQLSGRLATTAVRSHTRWSTRSVDPARTQERALLRLVAKAKGTRFGIDHDFAGIRSVADFQERVPVRTYPEMREDYWAATFPVLDDISWPGRIRYLARSSGTTTGESKFIPVSDEMVRANRLASTRLIGLHLLANPASTVLHGETFFFGGSPALDEMGHGVLAGEISGIVLRETPAVLTGRSYPPPELAAIDDWNEKVERLAHDCLGRDIRSLGGLPNWLQVLLDRAFDIAGVSDRRLVELFPNLQMVLHGSISFEPYHDSFTALLEGSRAELREAYGASEGIIAGADRGYGDGLRLFLDNGLFYELIEVDRLDEPNPPRRWIGDAELGRDYALVLSTCAGLWAYSIGDIVRFVDLDPPRLLISGRVNQWLATFGEQVIGSELEAAVAGAARAAGIEVSDFAVAPVIGQDGTGVGHHRFLIETSAAGSTAPADLVDHIDRSLREQNAYYRALRTEDIAMTRPEVVLVPRGTFAAWMDSRGRLGGQNKVPRIADVDRLDEIAAHR